MDLSTLQSEASAGLRKDIALFKARQHELEDVLAGYEGFPKWQAPSVIDLPCGCVAKFVKDCDGENVWEEWVWDDCEKHEGC